MSVGAAKGHEQADERAPATSIGGVHLGCSRARRLDNGHFVFSECKSSSLARLRGEMPRCEGPACKKETFLIQHEREVTARGTRSVHAPLPLLNCGEELFPSRFWCALPSSSRGDRHSQSQHRFVADPRFLAEIMS
ncbi:hypothetical protein MUK42_27948 [Musa troglodytarum]|uniref:Uncharacterized protein n=1 Tax=Musa troglodytarum TaxID=320322 RepID=A0A9E7JUS9_9LILI|nr:hypothetical protein MUK42_27948 [Musa troglodytarum]